MSHYQSKSYNHTYRTNSHTYRINSFVHSGASRVDCCVCIDCFYVLIVVYVLSCSCWMIFPPYEYICTAHLCKFSVIVGDTFMLAVYPAYHSVNWTSSLVSATTNPVDCCISTANTLKMMVSVPSSDMSIYPVFILCIVVCHILPYGSMSIVGVLPKMHINWPSDPIIPTNIIPLLIVVLINYTTAPSPHSILFAFLITVSRPLRTIRTAYQTKLSPSARGHLLLSMPSLLPSYLVSMVLLSSCCNFKVGVFTYLMA